MAIGSQCLCYVACTKIHHSFLSILGPVWQLLGFCCQLQTTEPYFENQYEVLCADEPQDASSWPSLLERAQHTTLELTLRTEM